MLSTFRIARQRRTSTSEPQPCGYVTNRDACYRIQCPENLSAGARNFAIGKDAGYNVVQGDYNLYIGHSAGKTNQAFSYNTAIGYQAQENFDGQQSTAVGYKAGRDATGTLLVFGYNAE